MQIVKWTRYLSYVTFRLSRVFQLISCSCVLLEVCIVLTFCLTERAGNVLFASQWMVLQRWVLVFFLGVAQITIYFEKGETNVLERARGE